MTEHPDHEWLLARERGEVVDPPREQLAAYRRVEQLLRELPEVPADARDGGAAWERRVLAAIDAEAEPPPVTPPRRARRRWIAGASVAAAAAAAIAIVVATRPRPSAPDTVQIVAGAATYRGDLSRYDAHLGDTLVVRGARGTVALRAYDDESGALIASCTGADCERGSDGRPRLSIKLTRYGHVRPVRFASASESRGDRDQDLHAAEVAHAGTELLPLVHVF